MCGALSLFVEEARLIVVDNLDLPEIKTRGLADALRNLGADHALLVDFGDNDKLIRSANNLASHRFMPPEGLNVYDILRHNQLVISHRAITHLQERLERPIRVRRLCA